LHVFKDDAFVYDSEENAVCGGKTAEIYTPNNIC